MRWAEYRLSPRIRLAPGDAVRVSGAGWRGLYRFVSVWSADATPDDLYADVIGPVSRGHEIMRSVPVAQLRSAGRATRAQVEMHSALRELSRRAQDHRR